MTTAPATLYLQLRDGEAADLEVVARAAIAWSKALKEAVYLIDPSVHVETKLHDASEGSLSINGLLRFLDGKLPSSNLRILAAAAIFGTGVWVSGTVATRFAEVILDGIGFQQAIIDMGDAVGVDLRPEVEAISPEEARRIAEQVALLLQKPATIPHTAEVFQELEKDPAIKAVGVSGDPDSRPRYLIPRHRFGEYSGTSDAAAEADKRTTRPVMDLLIISPRLADDERVWRFVGQAGEFGAAMADKRFRYDFINGNLALDIKEGIWITAVVKQNEAKEEGVWVVKERQIEQVLNYQRASYQPSFLARENEDSEGKEQ